MSAVIERSGVSSATLYRRFASKQALVAATMQSLRRSTATADLGDLAADVRALVDSIARAVRQRDELLAAVSAELRHDAELQAVYRKVLVEPRLRQVEAIMARAEARGELAEIPDPAAFFSMVVGAVNHRLYVMGEGLTPEFLDAVVRHALGGLARTRRVTRRRTN
jgi:AcrR family transcriptional regulator